MVVSLVGAGFVAKLGRGMARMIARLGGEARVWVGWWVSSSVDPGDFTGATLIRPVIAGEGDPQRGDVDTAGND